MSKWKVKNYKVAVKQASAGRGLFALEDIPKDVCFIQYKGRKLSEEEKYTSQSKFLFEIDDDVTLDGYIPGNKARFINHSCKPNSEFDTYKDKVFVFSLRKIKGGEEITVDYGEEYVDEYIKPRGCKCKDCLTRK
jgi:SET domain-containing protein